MTRKRTLTETTNGFDAYWVEAINTTLEDRGLDFRINDITDEFWARWIGRMIDDLAEGGTTRGKPNPMIVEDKGDRLTWVCIGPCKLTFFTINDGSPHSEGCGEALCFKCIDTLKGVCVCGEPFDLFVPATWLFCFQPLQAGVTPLLHGNELASYATLNNEHTLYEISQLKIGEYLTYTTGRLVRLEDAIDTDPLITRLMDVQRADNRRKLADILAAEGAAPWFDYTNQAWVIDGYYSDCGHDKGAPCWTSKDEIMTGRDPNRFGFCYGREHQGEKPRQNIIEQYANVQGQEAAKADIRSELEAQQLMAQQLPDTSQLPVPAAEPEARWNEDTDMPF